MKLNVSAIKDIKYDAVYANAVPTYLRSYDKFYFFIKLVTEYVHDSIQLLDKIDTIIHNYGAISTVNEEYSRSVMELLSSNYGISGINVQKDREVYDALQCLGTRRKAFSTIDDIRIGFLESAKVVSAYILTDKSILPDDDPKHKLMACEMELLANSELSTSFVVSNIVPQVTGVEFTQTTLFGTVFAYDKDTTNTADSIKYAGWEKGNWAQEIIIQR